MRTRENAKAVAPRAPAAAVRPPKGTEQACTHTCLFPQAMEGLGWLAFASPTLSALVRAVWPLTIANMVYRLALQSELWDGHRQAIALKEAHAMRTVVKSSALRLVDGAAGAGLGGGEDLRSLRSALLRVRALRDVAAVWQNVVALAVAGSGHVWRRFVLALSIADWGFLLCLWGALDPRSGGGSAAAALAGMDSLLGAAVMPMVVLDALRVCAEWLHSWALQLSGNPYAGKASALPSARKPTPDALANLCRLTGTTLLLTPPRTAPPRVRPGAAVLRSGRAPGDQLAALSAALLHQLRDAAPVAHNCCRRRRLRCASPFALSASLSLRHNGLSFPATRPTLNLAPWPRPRSPYSRPSHGSRIGDLPQGPARCSVHPPRIRMRIPGVTPRPSLGLFQSAAVRQNALLSASPGLSSAPDRAHSLLASHPQAASLTHHAPEERAIARALHVNDVSTLMTLYETNRLPGDIAGASPLTVGVQQSRSTGAERFAL